MRFEQGLQQSQQQRQTQKLAMTQQLQQSIQILQFNSDELRSFLETKSLENPLIDVEVKVDRGELDYPTTTYGQSKAYQEDHHYLNQIPDTHLSLFEYLLEQIHLNYRDTYLRKLLLFLVEYLDVNGYLSLSLEKAIEKTGASYIEMLDALTLLQQLDPPGVGARNIQECLMLQTERDNNAPLLAYITLEEEFDHLVHRKWKKISEKYDIPLSAVQEIFDYLQTLSPFPGASFNTSNDLFIQPDLSLEIDDNELKVSSKKSGVPTIIFQTAYFEQMKKVSDVEVQDYMKDKKMEYDWIQKSILQRGETILKVGTEIVKRQKEFFLTKEHHLKPLTLKEIAEALTIHESTVSRAVNGKYLATPFGTYELRSFFSTALEYKGKNGDANISSSTVKESIKKLVDGEDKSKPLSDQKLVDFLQDEGISISRRTITKYREALKIPSSAKRKRFDHPK